MLGFTSFNPTSARLRWVTLTLAYARIQVAGVLSVNQPGSLILNPEQLFLLWREFVAKLSG
jgi:hypothetical protein